MAGFGSALREMFSTGDDEYEEIEDYQDDIQEEPMDEYEDTRSSARRASPVSSDNKVVNIHATAQLQVVLFKPQRFGEETRSIADELIKRNTVVLNLEDTNKDVSRRIIDFLSGVAYANSGHINRVATSTYIITPINVDLTGNEVLDELENNGVYF